MSFCGGSNEGPTTHRGIAAQLGTILAENGVRLVFGGGSEGLMGSISAACLQAGGTVHGIIPQFLKDKEQPADNLSRLEVVETLHIRTQRMAQESHAFCALPGGFGTIEEILEFSTWRSLGRQNHPFVLVNPDGVLESASAVLGASASAWLHTPSVAGSDYGSAFGRRSFTCPSPRRSFWLAYRCNRAKFIKECKAMAKIRG